MANREKSYNRGFGGQRCKLCTYWAVATGIQDVPGLQVQPFCFGHECQKLIEAPAIENLPSLNALAFKIQVLSCSLRILEFLPHFRYSICALVSLSDEKARAAGIAAALAAQKIGVAALTRCDGDLLLLTLWFFDMLHILRTMAHLRGMLTAPPAWHIEKSEALFPLNHYRTKKTPSQNMSKYVSHMAPNCPIYKIIWQCVKTLYPWWTSK